jgi:hypothetical protein
VARYKDLLQAADEPRQGDRDGRGVLTEAGLAGFCRFFLGVCVDEVEFMKSLLDAPELLNRVDIWTNEEVQAKRLPKGAWRLLREAILVGEFARVRVPELTGYQDRQARTVFSALTEKGLLISDTSKSHVRLGFPSAVVERWFPGLYQPKPAALETNKPSSTAAAAVVGDKTAMVEELIARATRRGWPIPENFSETLAIYADESALAAMLEEVWQAEALDDLLSGHDIDPKKLANG